MKAKRILILLSIIIFFNKYDLFAVYYNYNIATVKTLTFNNGLPISTGNSAGVQTKEELTFSGFDIVSSAEYNIATVKTLTFNNGLPISTGKSAKVITDLSIGLGTGATIGIDMSYNVATIRTLTFNNGLPISTGKSAKVITDKTIGTGTGVNIDNDIYYNIATTKTLTFNNGLPISTGKAAKVMVDYTLGQTEGFLFGSDIYYNIASIRTLTFNNGLPISTGKTAKVIVSTYDKMDEYSERYTKETSTTQVFKDENGNLTLTGNLIDAYSTGGTSSTLRDLYTNSKNYVYLGKNTNPTGQQLEIFNGSGSIIKKINKSNIVVHGDDGYFQKMLKKNIDNTNLNFGQSLNLSTKITTAEVRFFRQRVNIMFDPLPPVLTYPFYTQSGSESYISKTNYPTIKGMAYPDSTISVKLDGKIYYVHVDLNGLYEFTPYKLADGQKEIVMQYELLNEKYTNYLLKKEVKYTLIIDGTKSFNQPYISNIYNDDDIYSDLIYISGYGNSGVLNYDVKDITNTQVLYSGSTLIGEDKKFEVLLLEKDKLTLGNDYIMEVWGTNNKKERKAFTLIGNTNEKIGIINYADYDTSITNKPVIIGYSKVSSTNNDTIRGYACIIGSGAILDKCSEDNRVYLGSTNADKNGMFIFETMTDLVQGKLYLIELYNTSNLKYTKNIILYIDNNNDELLNKSYLTNIFNGIKINTRNNFKIKGMTLSGTTINILDNGGNLLTTSQSNNNGMFESKIDVPADNIFKVKYIKGAKEFTKIYKLDYDSNYMRYMLLDDNYYQDFDQTDLKIVDWRY